MREEREFLAYCSTNPIDDQSNYHLPIAHMHATLFNINRGKNSKAKGLGDFMLFREDTENTMSLDEQLLTRL